MDCSPITSIVPCGSRQTKVDYGTNTHVAKGMTGKIFRLSVLAERVQTRLRDRNPSLPDRVCCCFSVSRALTEAFAEVIASIVDVQGLSGSLVPEGRNCPHLKVLSLSFSIRIVQYHTLHGSE